MHGQQNIEVRNTSYRCHSVCKNVQRRGLISNTQKKRSLLNVAFKDMSSFYPLLLVLYFFILILTNFCSKFYNEFISCLYIFRAPCAHRQEVKILLHSIWYHHTETVSVWWYQRLYSTILTSWRWVHSARNM